MPHTVHLIYILSSSYGSQVCLKLMLLARMSKRSILITILSYIVGHSGIGIPTQQ